MKYKLYSKIKENKLKEEEKFQSALKKRNILAKKGEVSQMNQELRKIFIKKKEQTFTAHRF